MYYLWLLLAAGLVGIDRLTKFLVYSNMQLSQSINLIKIGDTEVLNLYYCQNSGAAFSRLSGKTIFLIVITSLVIIGLLVLVFTKRIQRKVTLCAVSLMIGGGVGNLIDRIFNGGKVIDFIDVRFINFPIFNFADICAVCGAGLLILTLIIDEVKERRQKKAPAEGSADTNNKNGVSAPEEDNAKK